MVLGILALVPTFPGRSLPTHPQKFIGAQRLRTLNQPAPISRQWSKPFKIFRSEKPAGGEKEQGWKNSLYVVFELKFVVMIYMCVCKIIQIILRNCDITSIYTSHYILLHYITLYYITIHYITLHYITLHCCLYGYVYIYKYMYMDDMDVYCTFIENVAMAHHIIVRGRFVIDQYRSVFWSIEEALSTLKDGFESWLRLSQVSFWMWYGSYFGSWVAIVTLQYTTIYTYIIYIYSHAQIPFSTRKEEPLQWRNISSILEYDPGKLTWQWKKQAFEHVLYLI